MTCGDLFVMAALFSNDAWLSCTTPPAACLGPSTTWPPRRSSPPWPDPRRACRQVQGSYGQL